MASSSQGPLGLGRIIVFLLPLIPASMTLAPLGNVLPVYYAKSTAVTLATLGLVLFATRITDAIADQLIGYWSDATRSRFGRRKPWIAAGAVVASVGAWFLYTPPPNAGGIYLFVSLSLVYLGWSLLMVPHHAWMAELTRTYEERTLVASVAALTAPLGMILVLLSPFLPIFPTTEFTGETLAMVGGAICIVLPLTTGLALWLVPDATVPVQVKITAGMTVRAILANRPFQNFLAVFLIAAFVTGMMSSLIVLYMDLYLKLGPQIAMLLLLQVVVGIAAVPVWYKIIGKVEKHRALTIGSVLMTLMLPLLWFMKPGPDAFLWCLAWMLPIGAFAAVQTVVPTAMLADIIDYDEWRTGVGRAGSYFAFYGLVQKAVAALGGGLAFIILSWFDFDPKAAVLTAHAQFGLLFTIVVLPMMFSVAAIILVWFFPITRRRHNIIRRALDRRRLRTGQRISQ